MKTLIYASAVSLMLHSAILYSTPSNESMTLNAQPPKQAQENSPRKQIEFLPKSSIANNSIEISSISKEALALVRKKSKGSTNKTCKDENSYVGVGIIHEGWDNTIIDIAPGYAADRAGIVRGDRVIGFWDEMNVYHPGVDGVSKKGALGTKIAICISRMGMTLVIPLIREKICNK